MKIGKILLFLISLILFACEKDDESILGKSPSILYLDNNGVTIKAHPSAQVGNSGSVNGVIFTVVDSLILRTMIVNGTDISKVCVSKITNMGNMFSDADTFNQDISSWDVSNVTSMNSMFYKAKAFNQSISSWDVSNVMEMSNMFIQARVFNQDISSWDVSSVANMTRMFGGARAVSYTHLTLPTIYSV